MGVKGETVDPVTEYDDAFDEASGEAPVSRESDDATAVQEGDDDATSAGESGTGDGDGGEEATSEAGEGDSGDEPAESGQGDDEAAAAEGDGDAASDAVGSDDNSPQGQKPAEAAPELDDATLQRAADILKQRQQAQQPAQQEQAPSGEQGEPEPEPEPKTVADYIPEDKRELVSNYEKEWPEVAEAEEIKRQAQLQHLRDQIYSEVGRALAPVFETTQQLQVDAHRSAIRQEHPDFEDVKGDLMEWIAGQPEFVRPAYEQVAQKGSAADVVSLLNQFKAATGKTGAVPEPASSARTPQQPKPKPKPTEAAKKALAAAPSPRQAQVPGSANPNDYDAAFDEAADAIEGKSAGGI